MQIQHCVLYSTKVHANTCRNPQSRLLLPVVPTSHDHLSTRSPSLLDASRRHLLLGSLAAAVSNCLLSPAFAKTGASASCKAPQSPIDVPLPGSEAAVNPAPAGQRRALKFRYPRFVKGTVTNEGQGAPQVKLSDEVLLQWGEDVYRLEQFTFHTPGEHALGGRHAPMDVQLVHRNTKTGDLLVLAVALETGATLSNAAIDTAVKSAPPEQGVEVPLNKPISLLSLLPKPGNVDGRRPYATYSGTFAPGTCPQAAQWVVFLDPLQIPARQVLELMYFGSGGKTLQLNAAPEQPGEGRQLAYVA